MQTTIILLASLALAACAIKQAKERPKPAHLQGLKGWQTVLGIVAVVLALLIVLNPEFMALGLLGDTTFFDLLVLALSLQLQAHVVRAWHSASGLFIKGLRWMTTPSLGTSYLLGMSTLVLASTVAAMQKAVHRIFG
jgi:uncharacterized membrane protein YkgB